ncbi:MAG: LysM peptidoglycan-binding domain-containing protein [Thiotrichales bacterium]|nr:MAG: LysM peptidoglycan-binding domain-containing protein [Thiotrichales bacterium]
MTMRTTARFSAAVALSLGLLAGCATTGEDDACTNAEQAIANAKATNAEAAALGNEWRDTGKIIKNAEKALAEDDCDKALALANQALAQAENAKAQAAAESQKFLDRTASDIDDSAAAGAGGMDNYTVVGGDNLWNISGKSSIYGDPYQWPLIFKANRSQIKDPDLIYPGQNFAIDRNASSSEIDAAINHARTRGAWSVGDVEQSDLDFLAR